MKFALKVFWGCVLGYVVSRIGFADFHEVHQMFLLTDFRMFLAFASGTAVIVLYFLMVSGFRVVQEAAFHPGIAPGSVLFGTGWALTGGCPAVVLLQLSHGSLGALSTFAGICVGMVAYRFVHERYFGWAAASCEA